MPSMAFFKQCNVGWENIPRSHNLLSGWANSYRFGVCIRQNMHVYNSLIYICTHTLYIKCLHIHVHISNTVYVNLQQPLHSLHVVLLGEHQPESSFASKIPQEANVANSLASHLVKWHNLRENPMLRQTDLPCIIYIYIFCLFTKLVAWPWVVKGWWLSLSDNSDISFFKQKFQKFSHSTLPLKLTAPPWKWVLGRLGSFLAGLAYLHRKNIYKHNWLEPVFQLTTGKPKIGGFGSMFFSTFPRGVQHRREFCGLLFSRMLGFAWPRCVEKVLSIDIYLKK